jgi:hypothetical protein
MPLSHKYDSFVNDLTSAAGGINGYEVNILMALRGRKPNLQAVAGYGGGVGEGWGLPLCLKEYADEHSINPATSMSLSENAELLLAKLCYNILCLPSALKGRHPVCHIAFSF